jgi:outer membrane biosynthesis protein TonB
MIPRTLVPVKLNPAKPGEARKPGHRLETYMDERTVVPSGLSDAPPLDGRTTIPAHFPLDVLVNRTLVPRGMAVIPLPRSERDDGHSIAIMDERTVVPAYVEPADDADIEQQFNHVPEMTAELREVIEPDILLTGDANLLIEPATKGDAKADLVTRVLSVAVHVGLIIFLIFIPKMFPPHVPTDDEIAIAQKELNFVYMPPSKPSPPPAPSPKMNITPKILKRVAPPVVEQPPAPAPVTPPKADLPEAPRPQSSIPQAPTPQRQQALEPIQPLVPQPNGNLKLDLQNSSPGREIRDQELNAQRQARGNQGPIYPSGPGGGGSGAGGPGMGQGVQILSDTQGVDFTNYINRLLATLKRNWLPLIPESAAYDKGVVTTTFQINPDGSVPRPDPTLERTSGREPMDNAAMGAIHASNPFEPLPKEFHGPYLRIRIYFLYNLTPEQLK